jgi:hypothetical protein
MTNNTTTIANYIVPVVNESMEYALGKNKMMMKLLQDIH